MIIVLSGTKSAPREIVLENSILPKDTGFVRVSTPPRVISLNDHHFPSASDEPEHDEDREQQHYYYQHPKTLNFAEDPKKGMKNNRRGIHSSQEFVINNR
jgi:mitochondrial fission factor